MRNPNRMWFFRKHKGALLFFLMLEFTFAQGIAAEKLEKKFVWRSFGHSETLQVKVSAALYLHYTQKPRNYRYGSYIKEDAGYEINASLAHAFEARALEEALSEWEKINMVIDFVQSLEYQTEVGEYPKYPIETLEDGGGDCEDTAILLAAILEKMGIDCVLLSPPGHMALGIAITGLEGKHYIYDGRKYFYVETTGINWDIGIIPTAYSGTAKVYELPVTLLARHSVAITSVIEADDEESMLIMVAFSRSQNGSEDPKTHETVFRYEAHLETDAATLQEVEQVQYRRIEPTEKEIGKIPWLVAYDAKDKFQQEWKGLHYLPVQVRIFFKDGSMLQTRIDFAPKIEGD